MIMSLLKKKYRLYWVMFRFMVNKDQGKKFASLYKKVHVYSVILSYVLIEIAKFMHIQRKKVFKKRKKMSQSM